MNKWISEGGSGVSLKGSQSFKEKRATSVPGRVSLQVKLFPRIIISPTRFHISRFHIPVVLCFPGAPVQCKYNLPFPLSLSPSPISYYNHCSNQSNPLCSQFCERQPISRNYRLLSMASSRHQTWHRVSRRLNGACRKLHRWCLRCVFWGFFFSHKSEICFVFVFPRHCAYPNSLPLPVSLWSNPLSPSLVLLGIMIFIWWFMFLFFFSQRWVSVYFRFLSHRSRASINVVVVFGVLFWIWNFC